ncbi:MAG TPA: DEAD/DEAH box helicase [Tepidisphaeraceae bacterium]|jgi:SNF2 family DNA or RNA helicase
MLLEGHWHQSNLYLWGRGENGALISAADVRAQIGEKSAEPILASVGIEAELPLRLPDGQCGWQVRNAPCLQFAPADAIDLLISLPTENESGSLRFFMRLARYVIAKLSARQFYPDVQQNSLEEFEAIWRLLVGSEDELLRLQQFAGAMPPSVRAVGDTTLDAVQVVDSFLAATTDAIIRRDVSLDEFFSTVHTRATEPGIGMDVRWLAALLGNDRLLRGSDYERAEFLEQLRRWTARLEGGGASSEMRLCFRLIEPFEENDERWTLRFELQLQDDLDDRIIEAEDLWQQQASEPGALTRDLLRRREQFRAELARAAQIFTALDPASHLPEPTHAELSTLEAHAFIRQFGPALEELGFGIFLPDWVTRRELELGLILNVAPGIEKEIGTGRRGKRNGEWELSSGQFGLQSLLDFDWQIAVGDLKLSTRDLQAILAKDSPLLRLNGRWVQIDRDAAQKAMDFVSRQKTGKMTLGQALRTAYGTTRAEAGLPVIGLSGTAWIDNLLGPNATKISSVEQPTDLQGTLRPYQRRGLDWFVFLQRLGLGACLADDMGLGKTVQLIALLLHERQLQKDDAARLQDEINANPSSVDSVASGGAGNSVSGVQNSAYFSPGPTLLFAPMSVVGNWYREVQRFAPSLKVLVHHGPERLAGSAFAAAVKKSDLVITTYALASRDAEDLQQVKWYRVALDEAQKIKNPAAAATVSIRALDAVQRVALTGTPIENHLSELWSIMEVLNPGLLGPASEFRERFAVPVEKLQDTERAQQLRSLIQPFVLRRIKTDPTIAGDLPDKIEMKVFCNLTAEQAAVYQRVTGEMLGQIDTAGGIRRRGLILAALTKLKQICDHPVLLEKEKDELPPVSELHGRSGKCERLLEMLEELLEEGDAALVFTQYRQMGLLLEAMISDRLKTQPLFLHGGTSSKRRDEMIQQFQAPKSENRVFILSLRAGGLGLNLTAANHVFHFDRWWNPAVESQATDRAHRIGQTRKVQVHKYVCVGTMEEKIDKLLTDKIALADKIVSSGDEWLTNLSTQELKEYLQLGRDAVAEV